MPASFSVLPTEVTCMVLEHLYLSQPLSRFCRIKEVCQLFNELHEQIIRSYEFPTEYFVQVVHEAGQTSELQNPLNITSIRGEDGTSTTFLSFTTTVKKEVTKVKLDPANDLARVNRAFYMIRMTIGAFRDRLNRVFGPSHHCTFKDGYVGRVLGDGRPPDIFNEPQENIPEGVALWHRPITNSDPPVHEISIDLSCVYGQSPGKRIKKVSKRRDQPAVMVYDVFWALVSWCEDMYDAEDGFDYTSVFSGLRWVHDTTYTIEEEENRSLYCVDSKS